MGSEFKMAFVKAKHAGENFGRQPFDIFYFSQQTETISMKCQILFSGKKEKKNVINLSSAEFAQSGKG